MPGFIVISFAFSINTRHIPPLSHVFSLSVMRKWDTSEVQKSIALNVLIETAGDIVENSYDCSTVPFFLNHGSRGCAAVLAHQ